MQLSKRRRFGIEGSVMFPLALPIFLFSFEYVSLDPNVIPVTKNPHYSFTAVVVVLLLTVFNLINKALQQWWGFVHCLRLLYDKGMQYTGKSPISPSQVDNLFSAGKIKALLLSKAFESNNKGS